MRGVSMKYDQSGHCESLLIRLRADESSSLRQCCNICSFRNCAGNISEASSPFSTEYVCCSGYCHLSQSKRTPRPNS